MSVLHSDSPLMKLGKLSGVHEDAVRCIYDERLNRMKPYQGDPADQLTSFKEITDDAFAFWEAVSEFPEDREGRRAGLSDKLSTFFDRVIRYASFHDEATLSDEQRALRDSVIDNAEEKKLAIEV